jgi:hypothetical protein
MPDTALPRTVDCPRLADAITVTAQVTSTCAALETPQVIAAQWRPRAKPEFAAFDAFATDGLACGGYFGAVTDGRYTYFCPEYTEQATTHGVVLRYDSLAPFTDPTSYRAFDAAATAGLDCRGYYGGACDGRFVYFVPRQIDNTHYHSRLLRYDTRQPFQSAAAWQAHDIGAAQSAQSAAFDGRYLYLCPGYQGDPATEADLATAVWRYDTQADFDDASSYSVFDLAPMSAGCFDGAAFDGRYVYLVPLNDGQVVRLDTQGAFDSAAAWQVFDAAALGMGMCVGAVFDGRWLYYVPYGNSRALRFDTHGAFTDAAAWQQTDVAGTDGLGCGGYDGGWFDGRHVWFIPFVAFDTDPYSLHADVLAFDTSGDFHDPAAWTASDAAHTDGLLTWGFNGGAFDGRYCYCAPWRSLVGRGAGNIGVNGRVLRCDTLGDDGGAFCLRACDLGHNGGLNAGAPGPSFMVNTERGVVACAAHQPLPAGDHTVRASYDGRCAQLWIDGALAAEREGPGAPLLACDHPATVGALAGGSSPFRGTIVDVRIAPTA